MLFEHPKNRDLNGFDHDNMHGLWVFLVVQVDFMIHQQHENMDITSNSHTNYRGYSLLYPLLSIISHEYSMNIPLYISHDRRIFTSLSCQFHFGGWPHGRPHDSRLENYFGDAEAVRRATSFRDSEPWHRMGNPCAKWRFLGGFLNDFPARHVWFLEAASSDIGEP